MFVIWGYNPADKTCHAYGPFGPDAIESAEAQAKTLWPTWTIVAQAVTVNPKYPQVADPTWLLFGWPFSYSGPAEYFAYISDDPATLDALGSAMQASAAANTYYVLQLQATV